MSTTVREDLKLCALPDFSVRFNDCFCTVLQYLKAIGDCHHFYYTLDIYHGRPLATHVFDIFPDFHLGKAGWFCCASYWCDYEVSRVYDTHLNRFEITDPLGQIHSLVLLQGWPMTQFCTNQRWCCGEENYEHDLVIQLVPIFKVVQHLQLVQTLLLQDKLSRALLLLYNGWNYVLRMLIQDNSG